jgi:hypothetical protein
MSFWSGLTGGDSGSTTEQSTKSNQTQTSKGTSKQTGSSVTSTLDEGTLGLLQGVIRNLGGNLGDKNPDAEIIRDMLPQLLASADPKAIDAGIQASMDSAIRNYKIGEGANIAQVQQAIGSRGNSFSALLEQQGQVDLATTLAQVAESSRAQGRQQYGQNVATAISGAAGASQVSNQAVPQFLQAIQVLEGGRVTQETSQTQLQDMLATLVADSFSKGHTSTEQAQGLVPTFTSLFGGK